MAKLLNAKRDGANEQIPAEPWRLASIEPPPLFAQFVRTEIRKSLKPSLHLYVASRSGRYFAFWQMSFRHDR
jgi:hypothetical protein